MRSWCSGVATRRRNEIALVLAPVRPRFIPGEPETALRVDGGGGVGLEARAGGEMLDGAEAAVGRERADEDVVVALVVAVPDDRARAVGAGGDEGLPVVGGGFADLALGGPAAVGPAAAPDVGIGAAEALPDDCHLAAAGAGGAVEGVRAFRADFFGGGPGAAGLGPAPDVPFCPFAGGPEDVQAALAVDGERAAEQIAGRGGDFLRGGPSGSREGADEDAVASVVVADPGHGEIAVGQLGDGGLVVLEALGAELLHGGRQSDEGAAVEERFGVDGKLVEAEIEIALLGLDLDAGGALGLDRGVEADRREQDRGELRRAHLVVVDLREAVDRLAADGGLPGVRPGEGAVLLEVAAFEAEEGAAGDGDGAVPLLDLLGVHAELEVDGDGVGGEGGEGEGQGEEG